MHDEQDEPGRDSGDESGKPARGADRPEDPAHLSEENISPSVEAPKRGAGEAETVSLLDLMREIGEPYPGDDSNLPESTTPKPIIHGEQAAPSLNEEATPADTSVPSIIIRSEPVRLPLAAKDLAPAELPPQEDSDATQVQPRSAFPGRTQLTEPPPLRPEPVPISERPTQPPTRATGGSPREANTGQRADTPTPARVHQGRNSGAQEPTANSLTTSVDRLYGPNGAGYSYIVCSWYLVGGRRCQYWICLDRRTIAAT